MNNMKVCPPAYDYEGATRANTQMPRRTEAPKRDSTVPPSDGGGNGRALVANHQRLKKPRRSVADAPKHNIREMGMFFLVNPDMKASDVFPKGMAELVCVDFTCKGCECTRENCSHLHPRKVGNMKKESVIAIGTHFLETRLGWFNEWHFLKIMDKLPNNFKQLMGGKDGNRSKKD